MKEKRMRPIHSSMLAIAITALMLNGCSDPKAATADNFMKLINLAAPPDRQCWGSAEPAGNNIDFSEEQRARRAEGTDVPPAALRAAALAGVVELHGTGTAKGYPGTVDMFRLIKTDAWDRKVGLCYGVKKYDKVVSFSEPNKVLGELATEVQFHWVVVPAKWVTADQLKAVGIQIEGTDTHVLQMTPEGWRIMM